MQAKRTTATCLALTVLALILAASAQAQILNGDFENGGTDWAWNGPADWWQLFMAAGGNPDGCAMINVPNGTNTAGTGCLTQTFQCGEPGGDTVCALAFDYWLAPDNSDTDPTTGIIRVFIDGNEEFVNVGPTDGWQTGTFTAPCGVHVIDICFEVTQNENAWRCIFDNVAAVCDDTVGSEEESWTEIKGLFR